MLGGVWVRREERVDGDTEIQRMRREKRTEVPNSGERNFGGKKGWKNFHMYSGRTEPRLVGLPERPLSQ